ncbi:MAG: hypothetical protein AB1779_00090 [Candidatus Thermoplasmatota archaeon]
MMEEGLAFISASYPFVDMVKVYMTWREASLPKSNTRGAILYDESHRPFIKKSERNKLCW